MAIWATPLPCRCSTKVKNKATALKILVLTSRFPYPLEKGDKLRAYYQIKELSRYHSVHVVSISDENPDKSSLEAVRIICDGLHLIRITPLERYLSLMGAAVNGLPFQVAWFYSPSAHKIMEGIIDEINPDHIYCQLARMAQYVRKIRLPKSLDYMDSFGIGMKRRAAVARGLTSFIYRVEAGRMIKYEQDIASDFDNLIIISEQDKSQLDFPDANKIRVVSNGVSETFFGYSRKAEKTCDLLFVGNMGYLPNIEAAEFLVREVLPRCGPNIRVKIAGANPSPRVLTLRSPEVEVTGWLDDIREAYATGRIFIAPIWSGTGQQNKILEAMAIGMPCITTDSVNNAIGAMPGKDIMIASSAEEFAQAAAMLLSNAGRFEEMSRRSVEFAKQNFSWEQNGKVLSDIFAGK